MSREELERKIGKSCLQVNPSRRSSIYKRSTAHAIVPLFWRAHLHLGRLVYSRR